MKRNRWVVVANVGSSPAAKRTDSSGDMEQLEMMEFCSSRSTTQRILPISPQR